MAAIEIGALRAAIAATGNRWDALADAPEKPRPLGRDPTPPAIIEQARANAVMLKTTRFATVFDPPHSLEATAVGGFTTHPKKMGLARSRKDRPGDRSGGVWILRILRLHGPCRRAACN